LKDTKCGLLQGMRIESLDKKNEIPPSDQKDGQNLLGFVTRTRTWFRIKNWRREKPKKNIIVVRTDRNGNVSETAALKKLSPRYWKSPQKNIDGRDPQVSL